MLRERGATGHAGKPHALTNREQMQHLASLCTSSSHLSMQQVNPSVLI